MISIGNILQKEAYDVLAQPNETPEFGLILQTNITKPGLWKKLSYIQFSSIKTVPKEELNIFIIVHIKGPQLPQEEHPLISLLKSN